MQQATTVGMMTISDISILGNSLVVYQIAINCVLYGDIAACRALELLSACV